MFLEVGDKIGIVAPSGRIDPEKVNNARHIFEGMGFEVQVAAHVHRDFHKFAATDAQRLTDLNAMIHDGSIQAIVCARGGYGAIRLLDKIDFNYLTQHPKFITGLSDITALHLPVNNLSVPSIHALMPGSFPVKSDKNSVGLTSLVKALRGELTEIVVPSSQKNVEGAAEGFITGGNLSLIYALQGTPFALEPHNKILFIEEVSEYYYHIDRMVQSLRLAGVFDAINGLIVGRFTDCKSDNFGFSIEDIILDALKGRDIPVCFNFPAGHTDQTLALPFGVKTVMSVKKENVMFNFNNKLNDTTKRDRR